MLTLKIPRASLGLLVTGLLGAGVAVGCGDDDSGDSGAPAVVGCNEVSYKGCLFENVGCDPDGDPEFDVAIEQSESCVLRAHIECKEDGCIASDGVTLLGDAGAPVDGGGGVTPDGSMPAAVSIGERCEADADCGTGFTCLEATGSDWVGGGPSGGYCTVNCADDSTVCASLGNFTCVSGSSPAESYCFEACTIGNVAKCHDRADTACWPLQNNTVCQPTCGYDGDCPEGRFCDLVVGVCVDDKPAGDPIGSSCDPADGAPNTCTGFCLPISETVGVCSGYCSFTLGGGSGVCGEGPDDFGSPGAAVCTPPGTDTGLGDFGFCLQFCGSTKECLAEGFECSLFDDPAGFIGAYGLPGICAIPAADAGAVDGSVDPIDSGVDAGVTDSGATDSGPTPIEAGSSDSGSDSSVAPTEDAGSDAGDATPG